MTTLPRTKIATDRAPETLAAFRATRALAHGSGRRKKERAYLFYVAAVRAVRRSPPAWARHGPRCRRSHSSSTARSALRGQSAAVIGCAAGAAI